jgi:uncharacterized membrane protein
MPREHLPGGKSKKGPITRCSLSMESVVSYILMGGVVLSVVMIGVGIAWHRVATGQLQIEYSIAGMNLFQFAMSDEAGLASKSIQPRLLISTGIAVLMLTPYVRVLASFFYFLFGEQNWKYSFFTGFVFTVLTYALLLH